MRKTQPLGVRGQPHGQDRMRRGRMRVSRARRAPLPQKQKGRVRLGGVALRAGAARRGAEKDTQIRASRLDCGRRYAFRQERGSGIRRDRPAQDQKRVRRDFGYRFQIVRPGAGKVSGLFARLRVVRRGTAAGYIRGMPHARARQTGGHLRHDDAAQRPDVRVRRDISQRAQFAGGLVRVHVLERQSLSRQAGNKAPRKQPVGGTARKPQGRQVPQRHGAGVSRIRRNGQRNRSPSRCRANGTIPFRSIPG